jgi:DeoR/GlpR family transcriptional regulator of sugar metabolism
MLSAERHALILRPLRRSRLATVSEISQGVRSSPATVRRTWRSWKKRASSSA